MSLQPAAARLLALLAVQGTVVQRLRLAGTLWPETTDRQAGANLRSLLWRIQQHHAGLLDVTSTGVRLDDAVGTDLWRFRERAVALLEHRLTPEAADIDLLAAELLPDWYDEWVVVERERQRQRSLHALESLCRWFAAHGRYALGLDAGLAAIAAEPLRESAHRALVEAHLAEGNHSEALRQYERYAGQLREEMGLNPSAEMRGLLARALVRNAAGPAEPPGVPHAPARAAPAQRSASSTVTAG